MLTTFSPTLPRHAALRPPVRDTVRSFVRPALAIAGALVAMAALMGLRLGLYAVMHSDMPVVLHLFPSH